MKILVIEGNKFAEILIRDTIALMGHDYHVKSVDNINEAKKSLALFNPDIILIDPNAPRLHEGKKIISGDASAEFIRETKGENPEIKIIAFSSHSDEDLRDKILKAGADYFDQKSAYMGKSLQQLLVK